MAAKLPANTVQGLVQEHLPEEMKAGKELGRPLNDALVEFIEMVAERANRAGQQGADRVHSVRPEHILEALRDLGYGRYEADVREVWEREKKARQAKLSRKKKGNSLQRSGLSIEELQARQEALFAKAKAKNA